MKTNSIGSSQDPDTYTPTSGFEQMPLPSPIKLVAISQSSGLQYIGSAGQASHGLLEFEGQELIALEVCRVLLFVVGLLTSA